MQEVNPIIGASVIDESVIPAADNTEPSVLPPTSGGGELKRSLTFFDGFGVVVGIMIGSGIFASPGLALERAGSMKIFRLHHSHMVS
jgi:hypothetical protein